MEDPVAIDLNIAVRHVAILDLLQVEAELCNLLVGLDHINLLRARVVKPVA